MAKAEVCCEGHSRRIAHRDEDEDRRQCTVGPTRKILCLDSVVRGRKSPKDRMRS